MAGRNAADLVRLEDTDILTAVCKNLAVGVIVCDADGRFVFFSPEAERILGIGATQSDFAAWSAAYDCYKPDMMTPSSFGGWAISVEKRGKAVSTHETILAPKAGRCATLD